jgi:hypothetical protein
MLYHHLLRAGVRIYEYCDRPLHGKVALMDDEWATVGSSNLDPLSLVAQPRGQRHHPRLADGAAARMEDRQRGPARARCGAAGGVGGRTWCCALFGKGRVWRVRGHTFKTPGLAMALLQLAMSCLNWSLMGGVIWLLLQGQVGYPHVLAVLLVAAVAGVVTHVPAGLGVLEAVFVALLSYQVAEATLLGALLAYRGLYYLLPLAVARAPTWSPRCARRRACRPLP